MADSPNSSTNPDPPPFGPNERQEFRREITQMILDLLDQRERQRESQPPPDPTDPTSRTGSTTSTETTTQATLKASEIGYFYPNMPPS